MRTPFSTQFNPSPGETTRSSIQILNPAKYSGSLGDSKEGKRKRLDTREDNHACVSNKYDVLYPHTHKQIQFLFGFGRTRYSHNMKHAKLGSPLY